MIHLIRRIRAALWFIREVPWTDEPAWTAEDAAMLVHFLSTPTGSRLKASLLNIILRWQADAVSSESNLKFKAGSCNGAKAIVGVIEELARPENFKPDGETSDTSDSPHEPKL